jgi:hypothetical protein
MANNRLASADSAIRLRWHTGCSLCAPQGETMKKAIKKLNLNRQTIRVIATDELAQAAGGWIRPPISWSCPQPSQSACCPKTES